ncbi:Ig-like domain-containing protein [Postechiella marina]|uniref:Ig-like domain-containing protein n=1 Tax=Postechiella marina TaxID=943941 RepID=A0ABP8C3C0_9FLAO
MNKTLSNFILATVIALVFINCANKGTPQGGEKDIDPPVILSSTPENYSTNFKGNEIKIYFDEYVKIKDLNKQLIISPPMKTQPEITPLSTASKYITIKIYDTLQPNTTYAFNFGNSIQDNNEGNPFSYYRYVLSTGDYIDSLNVQGQVVDATKRQPDTFVSVMLYEVDSTYHDSIVYKETPKYITNTLDSLTTFSIENVKEGKYKLIALKDANNDNKFQQKTDKIGFYEDFINIPTDSTYKLKLFSEDLDFKAIRPRQFVGNKIDFPYEGDYKDMRITLKSEVPNEFESRITKDEKTDTLYYWYLPKKLALDSLIFNVSSKTFEKDFTVKIKDKERDSLLINSAPSGNIGYKDPFYIYGSVPFKSFNKSKITILDQDSLKVNFNTDFDTITNTLALNFDKIESGSYNIQVLPEAITDFFGNKNDTLNYAVKTPSKNSFSNVRVNLNNAVYPIIVQLTNEKGEDVFYEQYQTKKGPIDFLNIKPNKYFYRIIYDTNGNQKYDTGNYLKKIQPEHASHFETSESYRADWSYQETFTLIKR